MRQISDAGIGHHYIAPREQLRVGYRLTGLQAKLVVAHAQRVKQTLHLAAAALENTAGR